MSTAATAALDALPELAALRQRLAVLVAPPRAGTAAIPTGFAALDRALSDGGVPCGRLTEIAGVRGSGRTTLVRQIVAGALAARHWVAYVDGARTLAPRDWAGPGATGRFRVVRPPSAARSAWCADVLLRSGAFGLVVLDGSAPLSRQVAVRLTRLAREQNAALVVVGEGQIGGAVVGSAVRLRVERLQQGHRREPVPSASSGRTSRSRLVTGGSTGGEHRGLRIVVDKGGRHHSVEVRCAIDVARRLCAHPEIPDRRGVASRGRWGEQAGDDVPGARPRSGRSERRTGSRTRR
ncbi:MAG TPA: hypothetical protein VLE53_19180 [Gemmatimonadaceae bacterium]|nr:hypothetical protein [Gemmatimonadaceae bacterium]